MAVLDHSASIAPSFFARFRATILEKFENYANARCRTDKVKYYEAMSDKQLAEIGLSRDSIVRHVFRDVWF